jgi:hypothetical protein
VWFNDPQIVRIVRAILRGGDPRLVLWARESTQTDTRGQVRNQFALGSNPDLRKAANQIATAGAQICSRSAADRSQLLGALVERLAYELVATRASGLDRERKVQLNDRAASNHLEIVIDEDPFEAYECKYSPARFNQGDIDQLEAVRAAAVRNGRRGVVGVVTLDSWRHLEQAVATLTVPRDLRHVCASDFLELQDGPPGRRLAKNMSGMHAGL